MRVAANTLNGNRLQRIMLWVFGESRQEAHEIRSARGALADRVKYHEVLATQVSNLRECQLVDGLMPQDPLALVVVLRGPLFGISDPELFAFKQSGGWFSIFQPNDIRGGGSRPPDRV